MIDSWGNCTLGKIVIFDEGENTKRIFIMPDKVTFIIAPLLNCYVYIHLTYISIWKHVFIF